MTNQSKHVEVELISCPWICATESRANAVEWVRELSKTSKIMAWIHGTAVVIRRKDKPHFNSAKNRLREMKRGVDAVLNLARRPNFEDPLLRARQLVRHLFRRFHQMASTCAPSRQLAWNCDRFVRPSPFRSRADRSDDWRVDVAAWVIAQTRGDIGNKTFRRIVHIDQSQRHIAESVDLRDGERAFAVAVKGPS